jgi:hypothetical protein
MASELRVNTLKDAAGNNSVAMQYVANGSEKCWVNLNGTGTIAIRDSLNVSGLVDNGTGDYEVIYSSAAADTNYTVRHGSNQYHSLITSGNKTTSSNDVRAANPSHTLTDVSEMDYGFLGDLA